MDRMVIWGAPNGGEVSEDASTELQTNATGKENLHAFFKALQAAAGDREKISILHYGDSQIEGDRMTSYIREKSSKSIWRIRTRIDSSY